MAKNLSAKMALSDTLVIYDRNTEATNQFVHEAKNSGNNGTEVVIARCVREVAEKSVSIYSLSSQSFINLYDEHLQP